MAIELKGDFIGFSFNGYRSEDLGIVRVSDGSRYNEDLLPTAQDKTVQVPGGDGFYYFGSDYTQKPLTIPIAFDNLSEEDFSRLSRVFGTKDLGPLIFDERPYKYYMAKANKPQLKYICFEEKGKGRVYKGEGTLTFTCYYPFARSAQTYGGTSSSVIDPVEGDVPTPFKLVIDFSNSTDLTPHSKLSSFTVNSNTITFEPAIKVEKNDVLVWDSKVGLVKKGNTICPYSGRGIVNLEPGTDVAISAEGTSLGDHYNLSISYKYLYN